MAEQHSGLRTLPSVAVTVGGQQKLRGMTAPQKRRLPAIGHSFQFRNPRRGVQRLAAREIAPKDEPQPGSPCAPRASPPSTANQLARDLLVATDCLEKVGALVPRSAGRVTRRRPAQGGASLPTVAACVRRFCLACLGAENARNAFDCESASCPLYVCMPFQKKAVPRHLAPPRDAAGPDGCEGQTTPRLAKCRASKVLVAAFCRDCQPEDRRDCGAADCPLFPWRPWQPGGQPKVRAMSESQKRRLLAAGRRSQFNNPRQ
jgi:hypothetical protein